MALCGTARPQDHLGAFDPARVNYTNIQARHSVLWLTALMQAQGPWKVPSERQHLTVYQLLHRVAWNLVTKQSKPPISSPQTVRAGEKTNKQTKMLKKRKCSGGAGTAERCSQGQGWRRGRRSPPPHSMCQPSPTLLSEGGRKR